MSLKEIFEFVQKNQEITNKISQADMKEIQEIT